jgi:hypothetical protein
VSWRRWVGNTSGSISPSADNLVVVADNPRCPAGTIPGPKVNGNGTFLINGVSGVTITNYNGNTFEWALIGAALQQFDMAAVIVKGGPNANICTYDFASNPAFDDSDTGLHAPLNHGNNKFSGLSHVQFRVDPKGGGDN